MNGEGGRPPYGAVALIAAAALAYEVLLTRLFAIVQWHHFASMMISVAMLGWGAAGTLVAIARAPLLAAHRLAFTAAAVLFGLSAIGGFLAAQAVAFNPLEALWDARQFLRLGVVYLCLWVPFLGAALALCVAFSRFGHTAPRLYAADILGAGLGALGVIVLLAALPPPWALLVTAALGLIAAALAWGWRSRAGLALIALALATAGLPVRWVALEPLPYKDLAQWLNVVGTRVLAERSGPLGTITVLDSPQVPLRHAPGLSLTAREPPPQLAVFIDGNGPLPVPRFDGDLAPLAYLDGLTSAAPYHLLRRPRVLILGAGTGEAVLQALYHGTHSVDAVEVNAQLIDLIEHTLAHYSGRPYSRPGVRVHVAEARAFVAASRARYDLIQLMADTGGHAAGLGALAEGYAYTVQAVSAYLERLAPGGLLALTRPVDLPPRDLVKLAAAAIAALQARGVSDPGAHLALLRSWRTGTLLVARDPFTPQRLQSLRAFCLTRGFDLDWSPDLNASEVNRYNRLDRPYFYEAILALLGPQRQAFIDRYKYRIAPATDDQPFHTHFFKWVSLPEWWALRARGGIALMEWGYPILVATLVQALLLALLLILAPLAVSRRPLPRVGRLRVLTYFGLLGLAFMAMEIAFIHRFQLFLGHPLYAVATVLAGFLIFAGLGSRLSERFSAPPERIVAATAAAIALIALLHLWLLPEVFRQAAAWPEAARIVLTIGLIAPLALAMGMPFPLGLRRLAETQTAFLPWAWGINASLSVVAALLALWLAMHLGFAAVIGLAALGYLLAAACFPKTG
ncbi:MAG: SAM-dependent methyltransferase [Thiobacillaceae bacterium]|nr:SAM-dependent methyltransferase [Thiobacillaceae bacterium]